MNLSGLGVLLSLGASLLFALITVYVRLLAPLDGLQVFAQRVIWSIPAVLLLVLLSRQWPLLLDSLRRLRREPWLLRPAGCAAAQHPACQERDDRERDEKRRQNGE